MQEYALVSPSNEVLETRTYATPPEGTDVAAHKPRLLPITGEAPEFDPLTEALEGPTLVVGEGEVTRTWSVRLLTEEELTALANASRRLIKKSVIHERVDTIGKLGLAFAALQSQPIYFGRWFAPDWPEVYADDEGLLTILGAIGCTPEEIAEVTAP